MQESKSTRSIEKKKKQPEGQENDEMAQAYEGS
jgi:hypothetical protein